MKSTKILAHAALATAISFAATGCKKTTEPEGPKTNQEHGLMLDLIDTTVSPREDFYRFANGNYLKKTEIPAEESRWGIFSELRETNTQRLHEIMKEASAANAAKGTIEQQIGDYYFAAMDSAKIDEFGVKAIDQELSSIEQLKSTQDLPALFADFHRKGIEGVFNVWVDLDAKNSERNIINLMQGGMGLPDRDYYFNESADRKAIREKYVLFLAKLLELSGEESEAAKGHAARVMEMETELAGNSMSIIEMRDPEKTYNMTTKDGLAKDYGVLNWNVYFEKLGIANPGDINVAQPAFMAALNKLLGAWDFADWKTFLKVSLLRSASDNLSQPFVEANFDFYERTMNGTEKMKPRWKRVVESANWGLGFALGKKYTEKYFSAEAKKMALEMVDNILAVMKDRLSKLEWMGDSTRLAAVEKVNTMMPKIGYPDKWRDYSKLEMGRESHIRNVFSMTQFGMDYRLEKIGKPVDKGEWGMPPQIVNAYYNPSKNEIVFPAGILQRPFFDEHADAALNYGGFGAVIGHELIHAFDDEGSQFDAQGNLRMWWTPADRENFEQRAALVREQYNAYQVADSLFINGQLTLGENIADIHGLQMSFWAWKRSLEGKPQPQDQDGYTPNQRFFLAFGQIWSTLMRPEFLRLMVATNPHSPAEFRVKGALSNFPEFYEAWGVKEGDAMWRPEDKRSAIW